MAGRVVTLGLALTLAWAPVVGSDIVGNSSSQDVSAVIRAYLARLSAGDSVRVGDSLVAARRVLPSMYEPEGYRPLWTVPGAIDQLLVAIDAAYEDGLDPEDYHLSQLMRRREVHAGWFPADPRERALSDLLLSDALVRLERHLRFGKVDPVAVDPAWDFLGERAAVALEDGAARMVDAIRAGTVTALLAAARPTSHVYAAMRAELARLRAIAAAGGWPAMPEGPTLRPGDRDFRVMWLRSRLAASGDLISADAAGEDATLYDESLAQSVRGFQGRHNIAVDGVTGPRTLEALRASPDFWIDQLRVNMERARWIRTRFDNGVIVDIAGFDARYVRDGRILWQAKAAVGTRYRKTPVLRAMIRTLVLNPTWTVPPTILAEDILPAVKKDPGYLDRRGIRVYSPAGEAIDVATVDWESLVAPAVPFTFRQGPGPENPLGRIKFLFPNPHFVYLHDTPSRGQFQRADRAASSGCIRIERPIDLAELLLEGTTGWNRARIEETIAAGGTKAVSLARPAPVYLLYSTAGLNEDGTFHFNRDIYDRDRAVLDALDRVYRDGETTLSSQHFP